MNSWQFTWLLWASAVFGSFFIIEMAAVIMHKDTLSESIVVLTTNWPWLIGVYFAFFIILGAHFWLPHAGT